MEVETKIVKINKILREIESKTETLGRFTRVVQPMQTMAEIVEGL